MTSHRVRRVADLIARETASLIQRELKDPRVGLVTITGAEVSPDLKSARIFFSAYGDDKKREAAAEALHHARGFIRRELGARLGLKSTPEIRFIFDDALDRGERIEDLLGGKPDGSTPEG